MESENDLYSFQGNPPPPPHSMLQIDFLVEIHNSDNDIAIVEQPHHSAKMRISNLRFVGFGSLESILLIVGN